MSKLLIIEDDAVMLYGLQAKFRIIGFEVVASNGSDNYEEMLNMIKKEHPQYIILDIVLPQIDGYDLLKMIKEEDNTKSIPIYIFTNNSEKSFKEKVLKSGAEQYFIKSEVSMDEFALKITQIIKNKQK